MQNENFTDYCIIMILQITPIRPACRDGGYNAPFFNNAIALFAALAVIAM